MSKKAPDYFDAYKPEEEMPINIPLDEPNWYEFRMRTIAAGKSVQSRYKGVYIGPTNGKIGFIARCNDKFSGKKFLGTFPLTKVGEEQAAQAYLDHINSLPPELREKKYKQQARQGKIIYSGIN